MVSFKDAFISIAVLSCITYTFIFLDIALDSIQEKLRNKKNEKILKYLIFIISIVVHTLVLIKGYSLNLVNVGKLMPFTYLIALGSTANVHVWCLEETRPTYYAGFIVTMVISIIYFF